MRYSIVALVALLIGTEVSANTGEVPIPPPLDEDFNIRQSLEQEQAQKQALELDLSQEQQQEQTASQDNRQSNDQILTYTERNPDDIRFRNNYAPGLGGMVITSECWIGGSTSGGSGWGAFGTSVTREDPWCRTEREAVRLAEWGLYDAAAKEYCQPFRTGLFWRKQNGRWKPFGDVESCESEVKSALKDSYSNPVINVSLLIDTVKKQCSSEQSGTVIKEIHDDGLLYTYECKELEVTGKGQ